MLNNILQWCRQSYRTSACSTKYYYYFVEHVDVLYDRLHHCNILLSILMFCMTVYTILVLYWACWCSVWLSTTLYYFVEHVHVLYDCLHHFSILLSMLIQSYRTSTCSTKYYNVLESHTEHQHAQQNNTMWYWVIQNINMLNKILKWCRRSYRTWTCSTK
jgi:hypothetical protein